MPSSTHKQHTDSASDESAFSWPDLLLVALLVVAALAAFFQIFPNLWFAIIDVGNWSHTAWIVINVAVVVGLVVLRVRQTG
jgi:hypothetical protein